MKKLLLALLVVGISFAAEERPAKDNPDDKLIGFGASSSFDSWTDYQRKDGTTYFVRGTKEEKEATRLAHYEAEAHQRQLYQDLRTRVLTDAEMKEAIGYKDGLNLFENVSFNPVEKAKELNDAFRTQNLMRLDAAKAEPAKVEASTTTTTWLGPVVAGQWHPSVPYPEGMWVSDVDGRRILFTPAGWSADLLESYEIGLRSDGTVVWRKLEKKPLPATAPKLPTFP